MAVVSVSILLLATMFARRSDEPPTQQPQLVSIANVQPTRPSKPNAMSSDFDGYQLQGTVVSSEPGMSTALIATKMGFAGSYKLGKPLPNGWTVAQISRNQVVLIKGFEKAALTLSGLAPSAGSNFQSRGTLTSFLNVTKTIRGYEFGATIQGDALRAGIKPGDIIQSINNRAVSDPVRDFRILQSSAESGAAELKLWRQGRLVMVNLPLR